MSNIYREEIIDLYKRPHNFGNLKNPTHSAKELNPLCGDEITINLKIESNKITDVKFTGNGCAISIASTSILTDKIKNMPLQKVKALKPEDLLEMLKIEISPARLKCALLCFKTLKIAIQNETPRN